MNYLERVDSAVRYIENNLNREIELKKVADEANSSLFYFHRIFSAIIGDTLKEYIRKRRLTEAARELTGTDRRIIDIAMDYGFRSQESFTRAFRDAYGQNPGYFRKQNLFFELRSSKSLDQMLREQSFRSTGMQPEIREKGTISVAGLSTVTKADGTNFLDIPRFWCRYMKERVWDRIPNLKYPRSEYGICADLKKNDSSFLYLIGEEIHDLSQVPAGLESRTIKPALYAVFTSHGPLPETLQSVWAYAYGTWFSSSSEWERADTEEFELYDDRCRQSIPEVDIYIPIKKAGA